jgi:arabinosyltransferase C
VIVLSTGTGTRSLTVTADGAEFTVAVNGHAVRLPVPGDDTACRVLIDAGPDGIRVSDSNSDRTTELAGQPVPQVFGFRTALRAADAAGMQVSVEVGEPFTTTPSPVKTALIAVQLIVAAAAMWLLPRPARRL